MLPLPNHIPLLICFHQTVIDFGERNPIPGYDVRIGVSQLCQWRCGYGTGAFTWCRPRTVMMIVMPYHLSLIEWHVCFAFQNEVGSLIHSSGICQLGISAKKMRIAWHVKHTAKLDFPRIFACHVIHQHFATMVNLGGKPSIAACTEHRASLCIGVEQRKIIGTQSVDAIRIEQSLYASGKSHR